MSRNAEATDFEAHCIDRPFSLFSFAEERLQPSAPIRRFLTLGRQREAKSLVVESVPAVDSLAAENDAIRRNHSDHDNPEVLRLSFWKKPVRERSDLKSCGPEACVGYALLKRDIIPSARIDQWHIFEAVVRKYPHPHNYSRIARKFGFRVGAESFSIPGCLYAQQNGLNKACAQVALRSLLATRLGDPEVSCEQINVYADEIGKVIPSEGLTTAQVSHVLNRYSVPHIAIDYSTSSSLRDDFPFEKLVYSGIESGAGSFVAFGMSGPSAPPEGHIVPCFGHTFNEDAWGPQAENAYFRIGEIIRYIPSRSWCSSFIAHDDNFGANLCIPMQLLRPDQVWYAVELLPDGYMFSGPEAEVASADYFYSLLPQLPSGVIETNPWMRRLLDYVANQRLILRSVAISRDDYVDALSKAEDWELGKESAAAIQLLSDMLPENMWMVEVTIPEIFSTNKRKLGEILLDAGQTLNPEIDGESFILGRFPESYVFFDSLDDKDRPTFLTVRSGIRSHIDLFTKSGAL